MVCRVFVRMGVEVWVWKKKAKCIFKLKRTFVTKQLQFNAFYFVVWEQN